MDDNSFFSMDRLIEFGLGMGVAQQMINVMNRQDAFQGKTFLAYGRIASLGSLEDPYYNGSWQIDMIWDGEVPAIGTLVELSGTIKDGKLIVSTINET